MSFLGIDIGSSQVKAVAFAPDGTRLAAAYRKYTYTTPAPGRMELDGNAVMKASFEVIAECAAAVRENSPVRAIACSSQGEAFSPVDAQGNILMPAMISGDMRASKIVSEFANLFGAEKLYRLTGHSASAMFSLGKLLWLREFEPEIFEKSARFLCFEDLLAYRLTGRAVMGWPLAGRTMLFNPGTHQWVPELLEACGIGADRLADTLPAGTVAGTLLPEIAEKLGLDAETVWVTGGHDQIIGAYGCGARRSGTAMCAGGSVQCLVPILDRMVLSQELFKSNLCTYDFAADHAYASVAYSLTGSNLTEYFIREIARDENGDYAHLIASMPDMPTGLLVLPYFTPSGTPYFDERTPACVYGWRFETDRGTLFKGLTEGVAMEMKLNCQILKDSGFQLDQLIATGGGFRNRKMVQLFADVFGLPISVCDENEAGCRGAATLAAMAADGIEIPQPKILDVVEPGSETVCLYDQKFEKWKTFSKNIRSLSECLS